MSDQGENTDILVECQDMCSNECLITFESVQLRDNVVEYFSLQPIDRLR